MLNPAAACALVTAALAALFVTARSAHGSGRVSAEGSRKILHVGMGVVCLTFPWLFSGPGPVLLLAAGAALMLLILRIAPKARAVFGCVLHGVERSSYGEFAFIAGVAATFVLANGDALAYVVPVAILTFGDALAALVGIRYGRRKFACFGGWKSYEGSAAFFLSAFACAAGALAVGDFPRAIAAALIVGCVLTIVEAASWSGIDNFAIPVLGEVLLRLLGGGFAAA